MQVDHPKEKCQNPDCNCDVEAGHPYCSEYCRNATEDAGDNVAAKSASGDCDCGHRDCTA